MSEPVLRPDARPYKERRPAKVEGRGAAERLAPLTARPKKKLPQELNIHATCVALGGAGVLLLGRSGTGKSDLALRLIDEGAVLVADDRVLLSARKGALFARAPQTIRGLMEVRGLGVIEIPTKDAARIRLAITLGHEGPRLPSPRHYECPLPLTHMVPLIVLDPRPASAPARIRMALAAFSKDLFRDNFNAK